MIQERKVFQSLLLEYVGEPTVKVTIDGDDIMTATGKALPNHAVRKTRRVSLPKGSSGYVAQMSCDTTDVVRHQFEAVPESQFQTNNLFQYFEITFNNNLQVKMYIDETPVMPNNSSKKTLSLIPRRGKKQDTRKIYFPPLTYGYVPHIEQVISSAQKGQVLSARPITLPPKYFRGLKTHSEYQVTYQGDVELAVYIDGEMLFKEWLPEILIPQDGGYKTHKDYLPAGATGQVLQWVQLDGTGDIALFETDVTQLDQEPPAQPFPPSQ